MEVIWTIYWTIERFGERSFGTARAPTALHARHPSFSNNLESAFRSRVYANENMSARTYLSWSISIMQANKVVKSFRNGRVIPVSLRAPTRLRGLPCGHFKGVGRRPGSAGGVTRGSRSLSRAPERSWGGPSRKPSGARTPLRGWTWSLRAEKIEEIEVQLRSERSFQPHQKIKTLKEKKPKSDPLARFRARALFTRSVS